MSLKIKKERRLMKRKVLWNPQGCQAKDEPLINGNPTGMLNMNDVKHKWSFSLWKQMLENTWFPEECNTDGEKKAFKTLLNFNEQRMYGLAFAQLSFNDALQADNLMDNINPYVTNKMIGACLTRQGFEEVLHSSSYAVLLTDAVEDSDRIFNLYKEDLVLTAKNTEIARTYSSLTEGDVTPEKFFYALVANQILEGVYFLSGFACIYHLGDRMKGSADMVKFIHRDENTHLSLFSNMIRTFVSENPDLLWFMIRPKVNEMFDQAYKLEVSWLKYMAKGIFSDEMIEATVAYFVKDRMRMIHMYDEVEDKYGHGFATPLVKSLLDGGDFNSSRTNFFEGNVKNYSKKDLGWDDDSIVPISVPTIEETWCLKQQTYRDAIKHKVNDKQAVDRSDECVGCQ